MRTQGLLSTQGFLEHPVIHENTTESWAVVNEGSLNSANYGSIGYRMKALLLGRGVG